MEALESNQSEVERSRRGQLQPRGAPRDGSCAQDAERETRRRSALARSWRLRAQCGENAAAEFLAARGYTVLERNLRIGHDEADLVALTPRGAVAVVEVKARLGALHGEERVNGEKRRNLLRLAAALATEARFADRIFQFDVVAVALREDGTAADVLHFEHAFDASGTDW